MNVESLERILKIKRFDTGISDRELAEEIVGYSKTLTELHEEVMTKLGLIQFLAVKDVLERSNLFKV